MAATIDLAYRRAAEVGGLMAHEIQLSLPPDPASAGRARRAAEEVLHAVDAPDEVIETTTLLVSEVVTNAVLHAGTALKLRCSASRSGARVEVADRSSVQPAVRQPGDEATTGRGLLLVESLAAQYGVDVSAGGKVVWFVVGEHEAPRTAPFRADIEPEESFEVTFLDLHVEMVRSTLAYGEAVLRELALLAANPPGGGDAVDPEPWHAPQFSLAPLLDALDAASEAGLARTDLTVRFPRSAGEGCMDRLALVDEGDQRARQGKLLTVAAVPEVAHCRRWVYRQINAQASGAAPEPWSPPELLAPVVAPATLTAADVAELDGNGPVVVADDGNRIVFVNRDASDLIGSPAEDVVGRRLTSIIPPEQRLAHLAGFARHQATSETRLMGQTVRVPLQRTDQTIVQVELRLESRMTAKGSRVFRALLNPISTGI